MTWDYYWKTFLTNGQDLDNSNESGVRGEEVEGEVGEDEAESVSARLLASGPLQFLAPFSPAAEEEQDTAEGEANAGGDGEVENAVFDSDGETKAESTTATKATDDVEEEEAASNDELDGERVLTDDLSQLSTVACNLCGKVMLKTENVSRHFRLKHPRWPIQTTPKLTTYHKYRYY